MAGLRRPARLHSAIAAGVVFLFASRSEGFQVDLDASAEAEASANDAGATDNAIAAVQIQDDGEVKSSKLDATPLESKEVESLSSSERPEERAEPASLQQVSDGASDDSEAYTSPIAGCLGPACFVQYVALPDPTFSWTDMGLSFAGVDAMTQVSWTANVLSMTSLSWSAPSSPQFPNFSHYLAVITPAVVDQPDYATVVLEHGIDTNTTITYFVNRAGGYPGSTEVTLGQSGQAALVDDLRDAIWKAAHVAVQSKAVAVSMFSTMNEYQRFGSAGSNVMWSGQKLRSESIKDFVLSGATEPERIIDFPVAKAVVRGMDTIQAYLPAIQRFGLWGRTELAIASLHAAQVDSRVKAVIPSGYLPSALDFVSTHNSSMQATMQSAMSAQPPITLYDFNNPWYWLNSAVQTHWNQVVTATNFTNPYVNVSGLTMDKMLVVATNDQQACQSAANGMMDLPIWYDLFLPSNKTLYIVPSTWDTVNYHSTVQAAGFFRGHLLGMTAPSFASMPVTFGQDNQWLYIGQVSGAPPDEVIYHYAVGCTPTTNFLNVQWLNNTNEVQPNSTINGWQVNMASPGTTIDVVTQFMTGPCTKYNFVSFRYLHWPTAADGVFEVSTPMYVSQNPSVNRHYPPGMHAPMPIGIKILWLLLILFGCSLLIAAYIYFPR